MELNPSTFDCKCQTLFRGNDRGLALSKQLLEFGKYIDAHTYPKIERSSPCQFMLSDRDLEAVTELLDNGAYVDGMDLAVQLNANIESFKRFLRKNENNIDVFHESVLNLALELDLDADVIRELLVHRADACKANSRGIAPLHQALSLRRHTGIIKCLLQCGADPNLESLQTGFPPLQIALMKANDAIVIEELLKSGADANKARACYLGRTPLFIAMVRSSDTRIFKLLLKGGADVGAPNGRGETALTHAAYVCKDSEMITELFKQITFSRFNRRIRLDSKNCNGLLKIAVEYNVNFAQILIKHSLITFKGDYLKLFDLSLYKESPNYETVSYYLEDCIREIIQMKTMKIRNGLSLLMFVTTKNTSIGLYPNNESTTSEENIIANYPIYSDMISPKVRHALKRGTLLNKLKDVHVFSNWRSSTESVDGKEALSRDSAYIMAKFLSNTDLHNFIMVFCNAYKNFNLVPSNSRVASFEKKTEKDFSKFQQMVDTKKEKLV